MIYSLRGILLQKNETFIVIECANVGYQVFVSNQVLVNIGSINTEVFVFTHQWIREDQNMLYGFLTEDEKTAFELLTSVSGVGAKVAIKFLSIFTDQTLRLSIANKDVAALTQVSGVGKKLAEKVILELKDKIGDLTDIGSDSSGVSATSVSVPNSQNEVVSALKTLGYIDSEIRSVMQKSQSSIEGLGIEDSLKYLLRVL